MRKLWYLLAVLLLQLSTVVHVNAQNGCIISDLQIIRPSPVTVNQPFDLGISIIVGCAIDSYVRSDITASFGSLSIQSSLIDRNATVARTGTYVHQLVLTEIGNWSLDGEMYIMGTVSQSPLAVTTYHYNINVAPQVPLVSNQTVTSVCGNATTTMTESVSLTVTQTTSFTSTVWFTNSTMETSTITESVQLISPETLYIVAAVLAVLFLVVLIGVIVGRRND
ncbi:MAG TPA: hypothetical protein VLV18_10120 [Terriglobales bacterium]|nr:hypothetical protein [Terriglobales bacterium]